MTRIGNGVAVYVEGRRVAIGTVVRVWPAEYGDRLLDVVVVTEVASPTPAYSAVTLSRVGPTDPTSRGANPIASWGPLTAEAAAAAEPFHLPGR